MKTLQVAVITFLATIALVALAEDALLRHVRNELCAPEATGYFDIQDPTMTRKLDMSFCAIWIEQNRVGHGRAFYGYQNGKPFRVKTN